MLRMLPLATAIMGLPTLATKPRVMHHLFFPELQDVAARQPN